MKYVIWFNSKVMDDNSGFFYRNRKEGFTAVPQSDRAKKFKTKENAEDMLETLKVKEGEYYDFEIREV